MMQYSYIASVRVAKGQNNDMALQEGLLGIEGVAVDTSVNKNKWQVPKEDLDFFTSTLQGKQLRIDHGESVLNVVGKVPEARNLGESVWFRAELGDLIVIQKVLRNYVNHVSVQIDSDDVVCSQCGKPTRKDKLLVHLCIGAWEIVHKPVVRELSIVASPAYDSTTFKPASFGATLPCADSAQGSPAATNENQTTNSSCDRCARNTGKHRLLMKRSSEEVHARANANDPGPACFIVMNKQNGYSR